MRDFRSRFDALSAEKQKLLLAQIADSANAKEPPGDTLTAYLVGTDDIEVAQIRKFLESRLPAYMIPDRFILVDEIPRLPNGKLDRGSLSGLGERPAATQEKPGSELNEIERRLVSIWEEVLRFEPVGLHDNFFEIGGDSILSIQIVAKAQKEGIVLAPNHLFEHQTIAELARVAEYSEKGGGREAYVGHAFLTPIQHWFFEEHRNAPEHWNQGVEATFGERVDSERLREAINHLSARHDVLRAVFPLRNGKRTAEIKPHGVDFFTQHKLGSGDGASEKERIQDLLGELQAGFDLANGPLFAAAFVESADDTQRLFIVAHHLIVDPMSWSILFDDLESLYYGEDVDTRKEMYSYGRWSLEFERIAGSRGYVAELDYWKAQTTEGAALFSEVNEDNPILDRDLETTVRRLRVSISNEFQKAARSGRSAETLLITALFSSMSELYGVNELCIGLERQLRLFEGVEPNPSGIAGWFTNYFPVVLNNENATAIEDLHQMVSATLAKIPNNGTGYGFLRYIGGFGARQKLTHRPSVVFNYLGEYAEAGSKLFKSVKQIDYCMRSPMSERYHPFEVNVYVSRGQLVVSIEAAQKSLGNCTPEDLAERFESALFDLLETHVDQPQQEFQASGLSQSDIESVLDQIE